MVSAYAYGSINESSKIRKRIRTIELPQPGVDMSNCSTRNAWDLDPLTI